MWSALSSVLQQLSGGQVLSSWRAQADSIHVLNEHVCLWVLYPLRLLLYLFTHVPLALLYAVRGGGKKREKKNPRLVLIQAFSSAFCPLPSCHLRWWPPVRVADISGSPGTKKPHISLLCHPTGREKVSICYYYYFFLPFVTPTQTERCFLWPKTFLRLPSGEHTNADSNTATNSSGLFRSAPDDQIAAT